jgi:SAM-dependent methyltransferase
MFDGLGDIAMTSAEATTVLATRNTTCIACGRQTDERVLAERLIRSLPENQSFGGRLRVVQCGSCGLRYLNPMPDPSALKAIYDYESWADSTNANPVLQDHFEGLLRKHVPNLQSVCEIGCGTGDFLARLESRGLSVTGVEFAEPAEKMRFKGPAYFGFMEDIDLPPASQDAICLLNTIEHLVNPPAVLEKIHRMLKPQGIFLVRCPNADLFHFGPYKWTVELAKYLYHRYLVAGGRRTGFTVAGFQHQHLFYFDARDVLDCSTVDPFNRLRAKRAWTNGNVVEGTIASLRGVLGQFGLGPELLVVAKAR